MSLDSGQPSLCRRLGESEEAESRQADRDAHLVDLQPIFTAAQPDVKETGIFKRAVEAASAAWTAYKAGPQAAASLEDLQKVIGELGPGPGG